jgi:hypothetical protein
MALLLSNVFITLLRGNKKSPSIIGIQSCDVLGWVFVLIYIGICSFCTFIGVRTVKAEQALKKKIGRGMGKSDVEFTNKIVG